MKTRSLSFFASLAVSAAALAQSTAFTYQVQIKNGSQAVSGLHDLRIMLSTAASGGVQVGTTQCVDTRRIRLTVEGGTVRIGGL